MNARIEGLIHRYEGDGNFSHVAPADDEVVSWDLNGELAYGYARFDDYLLDRLGDAIENL